MAEDRGDIVLCALDALPDPGCKGFAVGGREPFFVVRQGDAVFGYVNRCPHQGTPLDWKPDTFLTVDKTLIQCSTHAAQFRISDGLCLSGPCQDDSLESVSVTVADGKIVLRP